MLQRLRSFAALTRLVLLSMPARGLQTGSGMGLELKLELAQEEYMPEVQWDWKDWWYTSTWREARTKPVTSLVISARGKSLLSIDLLQQPLSHSRAVYGYKGKRKRC